jgi:sulfide dehydrogenase [flavocytochrome c] flavoprotein subunit
MPKSAHMANQHAKVCAAAVVDLLSGRAPDPHPMLTNTCYSFVSDTEVIHVASVHAYDAARRRCWWCRARAACRPRPASWKASMR